MVPMSRRGRPLLSWQLGCSVPAGGGGLPVSAGRRDTWPLKRMRRQVGPQGGSEHAGTCASWGPAASRVVGHGPGDPGGRRVRSYPHPATASGWQGIPAGVLRHLPEKVPEKTPGAWFTKLSMTAPGLREREVGLPPGVEVGLLPALAGGEQSICGRPGRGRQVSCGGRGGGGGARTVPGGCRPGALSPLPP